MRSSTTVTTRLCREPVGSEENSSNGPQMLLWRMCTGQTKRVSRGICVSVYHLFIQSFNSARQTKKTKREFHLLVFLYQPNIEKECLFSHLLHERKNQMRKENNKSNLLYSLIFIYLFSLFLAFLAGALPRHQSSFMHYYYCGCNVLINIPSEIFWKFFPRHVLHCEHHSSGNTEKYPHFVCVARLTCCSAY